MIFGLDSAPLPDGYVPLEAEVILKCLDEEGDVVIITRGTSGLKVWDRVGLLTVALDLAREDSRQCFVPDDEEDESDE